MTIVKREGLGRPMTWGELDGNFDAVEALLTEAAQAVAQSGANANASAASAGVAESARDEALEAAAQVESDLVRVIKAPEGEALGELPVTDDRRDTLLGFGSNGQPVVHPIDDFVQYDDHHKISNVVYGFNFTESGVIHSVNDLVYDHATDSWYFWTGEYPHEITANDNPDGAEWVALNNNYPFRKLGMYYNITQVTSRLSAIMYSDGFYYVKVSGVIPSPVGVDFIPDGDWECVGKLDGFPVEDLRNWGWQIGEDTLPALQKGFELTNHLVIPKGVNKITLVPTFDPSRNSTYPIGLVISKGDVTLEFAEGAYLYSGLVGTERYTIIDVYQAPNVKIINPRITGDVALRTDTTGEWGYGIRNYNSSNLEIINPQINYCWGDGILWNVNDPLSLPGSVTGRGIYKRNRRQGISVIACNKLRIEHSTGIETMGAANGPWATIDVEPDHNYQNIIGLDIGTVIGIRNAGPAFLAAVQKLDSTSVPLDIHVTSVKSYGCQRAIEIRGDGGCSGLIHINSVVGRDSLTQDFQTVKWADSCRFLVDDFLSVNPNRQGGSSSAYAVPFGVYNNYAGFRMGGIRVKRLEIVNTDSVLAHPVSCVNTISGDVGSITIDELIYEPSQFTYRELYNPAGIKINTNTVIYREFVESGSLANTRWANGIRNTGAVAPVTVTVPTGYSGDGLNLHVESVGLQLNIAFSEGVNGGSPSNTIRSVSAGKIVFTKMVDTWSVKIAKANNWSQGGVGRYVYASYNGGITANRPQNPLPWELYYDTTLGYDVRFRQDTQQWVKASGT